MSDNIPKDLCERQMNAYLDIPTEIWTDIFKLLPRKTLVKCVQPVNKVFKAICDKNVKSVHVIGDIDFDNFMRDHLEALAGSNCALAGHFRLSNFRIVSEYEDSETKLAFLRHSLDLLRHCQLIISPETRSLEKRAEQILAYLAVLEPAKPIYIEMKLQPTQLECYQLLFVDLGEILHHPTTLNCSRLQLSGDFMAMTTDNRQAILTWLHHRVHGHGKMRCLILHRNRREDVESLVEQCVQNFEQSKVPEDRRCFVLAFHYYLQCLPVLANFERKNPDTGEVLLLERTLHGNGRPSSNYRLLRCLASQVVDNGKEQLYKKHFKLDEDEQKQSAKVEIF